MSRIRYRASRKDSFFGQFLYEQVVPKDHFLVRLKDLIPWERFSKKLVRYYKGGGEYGPPPYEPVVLLKMLLVSYLYNLSERQTEEMVNLNLAMKYFVGLGVDEHAPDHATLTVFKERLLKKAGGRVYEELLQDVLAIAQDKGIRFGSIQVVDSVHTQAQVNVGKDGQRQKGGKPPRDPEARWGAKESRKVKGPEGREEKKAVYFYGYKQHTSYNVESGLITSLKVSPGGAYDGRYLRPLIEADRRKGIPVQTVAGDRGYDDGENHAYLEAQGMHSALRLNAYRTEKKDAHKRLWLKLMSDPFYEAGLKVRGRIERVFGEGKGGHGLGRCRYLGLARYGVQAYLTAIVINLKQMVRQLTGVALKDDTKPKLKLLIA